MELSKIGHVKRMVAHEHVLYKFYSVGLHVNR